MGLDGWAIRRLGQAEAVVKVTMLLDEGRLDDARAFCRETFKIDKDSIRFPIKPGKAAQGDGRVVPPADVKTRMRIACRDGFVDRYSEERWRLVNPGALRVIHCAVGDLAFPTVVSKGTPRSPNVNVSVWWDLWPTVDHKMPRSRGGTNEDENLICTSWWRNATKDSRNTEETGWPVHEGVPLAEWGGLSKWFVDWVKAHPELHDEAMITPYYNATMEALGELD